MDVTRERIANALGGLLTPLARILLRCGVGYLEFAELAKKAYVEAASQDYGRRSRPANIGRIALITGLPRKEVGRLKKPLKTTRIVDKRSLTLPAAVLNAWHSNRRYSDRFGTPKVLPFKGTRNSFSSLVKSVARDMDPAAVRAELERGGAIRQIGGHGFVATKRHYIPDAANNRILVGIELGLRRLAETIDLNSDEGYAIGTRFQRFVEGPKVVDAVLPELRRELHTLLTNFSLRVDDVMATYAQPPTKKQLEKKAPKQYSVGVGLYYFDDSRRA